MTTHTHTDTFTLFTRALIGVGLSLATSLAACDENDEGWDQGESAEEGPIGPRCTYCQGQSPYTGGTYSTNWSETAEVNSTHLGGVGASGDDFRWVSASYGYWTSGTWTEVQSISQIRVDNEGQLEVYRNGGWNVPVASGNITRIYVKGDASNDQEVFHGYVHVTTASTSTVNSQTVYEYTFTLGLSSIGSALPTTAGNSMCANFGDGNQKVVLLPDVHLTLPATNKGTLVSKTSTDFTAACSSTSPGKGRKLAGVLPATGAKNYTVDRYNALVRAWSAWYGGAAQTYFGAPIAVKDLYNASPMFGGSVSESNTYVSGTPNTWTGMVLESIYDANGASCFKPYFDRPFDDCIEYQSGVHRYVTPPTTMSGWSSLGACNQSNGAGGVAVYIEKTANDATCEM